ncbi:hypothetical protein Y032_0057g2741 [Ancylostoma ceylanicum]|nr:hypothetical protein Y032_0057g2741 [Ancylostoma ceylanicum]
MKKGELRKFLLKKKSTPKQKLNWIAQAAYGLAYLHSSNFIHRDIAARNCLLTDHNVLKLADFGLTREGDIYHMATTRKLPIKWIPPEVILNNTFSFKSDVWSFGILAWEIMSNGAIPYQGLPNVKVKEMILKGEMNKFPPESNAEVQNLVLMKCWLKDPGSRCSMKEAAKVMHRVSGLPMPPASTCRSRESLYSNYSQCSPAKSKSKSTQLKARNKSKVSKITASKTSRLHQNRKSSLSKIQKKTVVKAKKQNTVMKAKK